MATPPNEGSRRLLAAAAQGGRVDKRLWTGIAALTGAQGNYTLATEAAIVTKRALLLEFNRRAIAAQRWGLTNVDEYAAIWSRDTGVPVDVSKLTLQARGFAPVLIDEGVVRDQQRTVDLYARERVLPRRYDVASAFDASFNVP